MPPVLGPVSSSYRSFVILLNSDHVLHVRAVAKRLETKLFTVKLFFDNNFRLALSTALYSNQRLPAPMEVITGNLYTLTAGQPIRLDNEFAQLTKVICDSGATKTKNRCSGIALDIVMASNLRSMICRFEACERPGWSNAGSISGGHGVRRRFRLEWFLWSDHDKVGRVIAKCCRRSPPRCSSPAFSVRPFDDRTVDQRTGLQKLLDRRSPPVFADDSHSCLSFGLKAHGKS